MFVGFHRSFTFVSHDHAALVQLRESRAGGVHGTSHPPEENQAQDLSPKGHR